MWWEERWQKEGREKGREEIISLVFVACAVNVISHHGAGCTGRSPRLDRGDIDISYTLQTSTYNVSCVGAASKEKK